jgi:hypothetical protein
MSGGDSPVAYTTIPLYTRLKVNESPADIYPFYLTAIMPFFSQSISFFDINQLVSP